MVFMADNSKSVIAACLTHVIASAMAVALYAIRPGGGGGKNATLSMISGLSMSADGGGSNAAGGSAGGGGGVAGSSMGEAERWFGPYIGGDASDGSSGTAAYYGAQQQYHHYGGGGSDVDSFDGGWGGLPAYGGFAGLGAKMLSENEIFNECDWCVNVPCAMQHCVVLQAPDRSLRPYCVCVSLWSYCVCGVARCIAAFR